MNLSEASRVIQNTHVAALRAGHRANALMLESGPGVGKSDTVAQCAANLAARINEPIGLVTFMLATISSVDVRGFMLPLKHDKGMDTIFSTPPWFPTLANTKVALPDGTWRSGTEHGSVPRVGVLFLDEFGTAEDEVKKPAAELLYKGAVGSAELPVAWRVVAAQNRTSDRSGVLRELMFIVNRRCKLKVEASLPSWLEWANSRQPEQRPHYLTMSFAQKHPHLVFRDAVPAGSDPFCTPRTLCLMDADLRALRTDEQSERDTMPSDDLAREVAAGWIGEGEAAQFFTHIKYADELPEMADIITDPGKAKLPKEKDAQMVCGYMLAHGIDAGNAEKVVAYMKRLAVEMQVLTVSSLMGNPLRARAVLDTKPMRLWLSANLELLKAARA